MPDAIDKIIDTVIENEGSKVSNDPNDAGGKTQYGISIKNNPEAWADGVVTEAEARDIYRKKYVLSPGFDKISFIPLQTQLVDFGVNSGPGVAILKLQKVLGVTEDGVLGPATLAKLAASDPKQVNNLLMAERVKLLGRIVSSKPTQVTNLNGWLARALEFLL